MALTLHYDFTSPSLSATVGPTLGITRATKATMVDADGYIREVQSGEARFTGATFASNLIDESTWTAGVVGVTDTVVTDNAVANPVDGTVDAVKVTGNNTNTTGRVSRESLVEIKAGHSYTFSIYAKTFNTITWVSPRYATAFGKYFDIGNGVVGSDFVSTDDAGIVSLENGWYRCWFTFTATADDASPNWRLWLAEGDADQTFPSNIPTTDGVYLYGAQVEDVSGKASNAPTDLIPTTTAAVSSLSGTSTGLLVEEERTNICKQSEDFTTTWTTTDLTVAANNTTAPDGSLTADKLTPNGVDTFAPAAQSIPGIGTGGQSTVSVYAKKDGTDWVYLDVGLLGVQATNQFFDLTNGVVGTASVGADVVASGIEAAANGFYRCWVTFNEDASDSSGSLRIVPASADGSTSVTGTDSIFVWGAQLEAGAFPTSYIPTTTASVTRNADDVTGTVDGTQFNADGTGSFYVDGTITAAAGSGGTEDPAILEFSASSAAFIGIRTLNNAGQLRIWSAGETADTFATIGGAQSAGSSFKISAGLAEDDVIAYLDGANETTDTSWDLRSTQYTGLYVGQNTLKQSWNGHIAEIRYYNTRLTNAQLENMSNGIFPTFGDDIILGGVTRSVTRSVTRAVTQSRGQ